MLPLHVQLSPLVNSYGNPIGDGLFSNIGYTRDDLIGNFVGEWISVDAAEERQAAGHGGYMIEYTAKWYLTATQVFERAGVSKASYSNSLSRVTNSVNSDEVVKA